MAVILSVIISLQAIGESLEQTLQSVEAQTFPSIEVVICGTEDRIGSAQFARRSRFTPLMVATSKLDSGTWRTGTALASGEFVCYLLSGDELAPTYLEKCLFHMMVNGDDAATAIEEPPDRVPHICVVRKRVLNAVGDYDVQWPPAEQRVRLAMRLARYGVTISVVPEALARTADPPGERVGPDLVSVPEIRPKRRASYARLITGNSPARRTILLAFEQVASEDAEETVSQVCRHLKGLGYYVLMYTTGLNCGTPVGLTNRFERSVDAIYHLPCFLDAVHWPAFVAYLVQQHGVTALWQVGSSFTYDLLPRLRELFPELAVVDFLSGPRGNTSSFLRYNYLIDHVLTDNSSIKEWLLGHGESEDRISVISRGIHREIVSPHPNKVDWRSRQSRLPGDDTFVAAFIGSLSDEKAPRVFLEAAALLTDQPAIEFLICGSGPLEAALRQEAAERGLLGRVHFLGCVSTSDCMAYCDAVVLSSQKEERREILMESFAIGIPVVASRVGGIQEIMPPGQEDLLSEADNADAIAAAIRRLASDRNGRRSLADATWGEAEENISIADAGRAWALIFDELQNRRQLMNCCLSPETVAVRLGYDETPAPRQAVSVRRVMCRALSPRFLGAHVRNALLLWTLRRGGRQQELLDQFDPDYYSSQFPAPREWKQSALLHYVFLGFREGLNPSPYFDTRHYLAESPDVQRSGVNPLLHFVLWGKQEGRAAMPKPHVQECADPATRARI